MATFVENCGSFEFVSDLHNEKIQYTESQKGNVSLISRDTVVYVRIYIETKMKMFYLMKNGFSFKT